jgi:hypothetical protein
MVSSLHMPYDHECLTCRGKGTAQEPRFDYEVFKPPGGGAPIVRLNPPGREPPPVRCRECKGRGVSEGHALGSPEACPACKRARRELGPLIELLRTRLRPAVQMEFVPVPVQESLPLLGTRLGGIPYAESGETWPRCRKCRGHLTFIGQFDTRQAEVPPVGLLTFFYCWSCTPSGMGSDARGSWCARAHREPDPRKAARIQPKGRPPKVTSPCISREHPILSHPDWDEVEFRHPDLHAVASSLAPKEPYAPFRAAIKAVLGDYQITHQIGGYGRWLQSAPRDACRTCGSALELVVQVDSHEAADCDWGFSGLAYLSGCRAHPENLALGIQRT